MIGQVADAANPFLLSLEVIHTISVKFNATSTQSTSGKKEPMFNSGKLHLKADFVVQRLVYIFNFTRLLNEATEG